MVPISYLEPRQRIDYALNRKLATLTKLFHKAICPIIWLFYLVEQLLFSLTTPGKKARVELRGEGGGLATHNFAKTGDLWTLAKLRLSMPSTRPQDLAAVAPYGMSLPKREKIFLKPHGKGHCFGAVTHFCRRYLDSGKNLAAAAAPFQGGMPLEAIFYHSLYTAITPREDISIAEGDTQAITTLRQQHDRAGLALGNVQPEAFPFYEASSEDFLQGLSSIEPGLYMLTFGSDTEEEFHATGLIVSEETFDLFEPEYHLPDPKNPLPRAKLAPIVSRLLSASNTCSLIKIHEQLTPH